MKTNNFNINKGANCCIAETVIFKGDVELGDNCLIEDYVVIGGQQGKTIIGPDSIIRSHSVIYGDVQIGEKLNTGHHSLIRERTRAGKALVVGSFSDVEGDCKIGDFVRLHSYAHVSKFTQIGDFVKLYSLVTITNDPLPPSDLERGSIIEDGVTICVGSTIIAGSHLKKGSFIPAGTVFSGALEVGMVATGKKSNQFHVSSLFDIKTGRKHPWMKHFSHHYPKEEQAKIQQLYEDVMSSKKSK